MSFRRTQEATACAFADTKLRTGEFFSHPKRRPEQAYARFGFAVFDRHPTSLFRPELGDRVEIVCAHKPIAPETRPRLLNPARR